MPVTTNVMSTVKSIKPQLEARGVKYQGLTKWNSRLPSTNAMTAGIPSTRN